jgi:fructose-1,6-bisphosphatase/inositol monophosphatase family enzyme
MGGEELLDLLRSTAAAIAAEVAEVEERGPSGVRPGQYLTDVAADRIALDRLLEEGVGVLSEESGAHAVDRDIVVVVDPVDGSTNASRGLPWYATSLCAVDANGPRAAVVANLVTGERFEAVRHGGATRDGAELRPSNCDSLDRALVAVSGHPPRHLGWYQFRAFGAVALDLCAVAAGAIDAYIDFSSNAHGPWDYLGGMLVCREAGVPVVDAAGRELVVVDHDARRTPVAAATAPLLDHVLAARAGLPT